MAEIPRRSPETARPTARYVQVRWRTPIIRNPLFRFERLVTGYGVIGRIRAGGVKFLGRGKRR
jgi:hypothetical protein